MTQQSVKQATSGWFCVYDGVKQYAYLPSEGSKAVRFAINLSKSTDAVVLLSKAWSNGRGRSGGTTIAHYQRGNRVTR